MGTICASSTFGAHLYAGHRLVTDGPFAFVRHPMYLGILLAGVGGLLLYRTWTFVFLLTHIPSLILRAWREEEVLAEEFGREWQAYRERTPAWVPHSQKKPRIHKDQTDQHGLTKKNLY
jgi:protein-S-isoprenylcysteine O-methyltransferase Ste14